MAPWHQAFAAGSRAVCLAAAQHILESSIFAGLIALACLGLRRRAASSRHAAWLLAAAKFAIPAAILTAWGARLASLLPTQRILIPAVPDFSQILSRSGILPPQAALDGTAHSEIWCVLACAWLLGTVLLLARWIRGWLAGPGFSRPACEADQRALRLAQRRLGVAKQIRLRVSSSAGQPGLWGIGRPVLVLPEHLSEQLDAAEFEAVLLHEIAHARREDNLSASAAHLIACVFWFHPLVWWIERQLLREREHACDEMVVSAGAAREQYASGILKVCRFPFSGPVAGVAGVAGANLTERIEMIMSKPVCNKILYAPRALVSVLASVMILAPVGVGFLNQAAIRAQSLEKRKGIEFLRAEVVNPAGKTADHTRAMTALSLLFNPVAAPASYLTQSESTMPYGRWLDQDVACIIAPEERNAFLSLHSDSEREEFVRQFWLRRDPAPNSGKNAFKEEHYRRLAYANQRFGTTAGSASPPAQTEGWQTDRGRLYIVMGPPDEIDSHPGEGYEVWQYSPFDGSADNLIVTFDISRRQ